MDSKFPLTNLVIHKQRSYIYYTKFGMLHRMSNSTATLTKSYIGVREVHKRINQARLHHGAPKSVMVVTKPLDTLGQHTRDVCLWMINHLKDPDFVVYVDKKFAHAVKADQIKYYTEAKEVDIVITLGGDGTVLYTSWLFQKEVPLVVPFHLGSLGFLTVFSFSDYQQILGLVFKEPMSLNVRMRLACTVQSKVTETFQILNELVVDRGPSAYMSKLELYADNVYLTTVQADGLVIATPTGSTAYSLAAGGSLVHPQVSTVLVTPVCPHTLSFRPMLLPDSVELKVHVPIDARTTAWASFDGRHRIELQRGDSVIVSPSQHPFLTLSDHNQSTDWFNSLQRCLHWNKREQQKPL